MMAPYNAVLTAVSGLWELLLLDDPRQVNESDLGIIKWIITRVTFPPPGASGLKGG